MSNYDDVLKRLRDYAQAQRRSYKEVVDLIDRVEHTDLFYKGCTCGEGKKLCEKFLEDARKMGTQKWQDMVRSSLDDIGRNDLRKIVNILLGEKSFEEWCDHPPNPWSF